jgi:hypothetical protein
MTPAPIRIDVWRGVKALLLTLVIPMSMAVMVDVTTGTLPWLTIAAVIICIPLATIVVNRTVLAEFSRIVAIVAPAVNCSILCAMCFGARRRARAGQWWWLSC